MNMFSNILANKASKHNLLMENNYLKEIQNCVSNLIEYDNKNVIEIISTTFPKIICTTNTTVDELFIQNDDNIAVIDFASYTSPGGLFLKGSKAQEESLCHNSYLFNILKRMKHWYSYNNLYKNKGLYENRALFIKDVKFFKEINREIKEKLANVIVVAAPNRNILKYKSNMFTPEENTQALKERIQFIKNICEMNNISTLIAGAFGCGVFRQDPKEVASLFKEIFKMTSISKIVFAIIPGNNYEIFKSILSGEY